MEIDAPRNEIVSELVFSEDATAVAAISGVYSNMINDVGSMTSGGIEKYSGLCSDEFNSVASSLFTEFQFANNSLEPENNSVLLSSFWADAYNLILNANTILEGLGSSSNITENVKNQVAGEAKLVRAFCHFNLVNFFGDIPLITTTNVENNNTASRTSVEQVYQQIIMDLKDASDLMTSDYSFASGERVRPNKAVANALLARVYLYIEDWINAEQMASNVINNSGLYSLESNLDAVFLANSTESIWQLKLVTPPKVETPQLQLFFLTSGPGGIKTTFLNDNLLNAFEANDNRFNTWVSNIVFNGSTFYFPIKYNNIANTQEEYSTILRLAEQYLIRAEARAHQGVLNDAIQDVDIIRNRAGLPLIQDTNPTISQADLLDVIAKERQIELFSEGHRWFDLIRTDQATNVLSSIKFDWQPTDVLWPIPEIEIEKNPNLLPQNQGY
ncbi:RagB/SusD family nutrient uptake outer membrane protein [Flavivirga amylovorans]